MEIFNQNKIYDFMGKKWYFLFFSLFLMISSLVLIFTRGFNFGIDFVGGTIVQIKYDKQAPIDKIRNILKDTKYAGAVVNEFGSKFEITIRLAGSNSDLIHDINDEMNTYLAETGKFEIRKIDMVGSKVGIELRQKGITALVLSLIAILIYIAYRFEWRFAIASILGLIHDVIITLGLLSIFRIDINLDMIAAILTLIGYTINDTIIVNDRIREQVKITREKDLDKIINESVSRTLSRTVLTSLSTLFVVTTMLIFGGEIIYAFSFTLFVGIIIGTYSSIYFVSGFLKFFGFSPEKYRIKEAEILKRKKDKEKLRSMYEQGSL